jgi:hypothetical protein
MSIGNLKTEGNKGNNFPFQLKVLQGLQCTCDELKAIGIDTAAIEVTLLDIETAIGNLATETTLQAIETNTTGVARTPNFLRPSGSAGTVTAGVFSMSFASVGTGNATVGGMTLKPGETINFDAGALNNTLGAVAYDTTAIGSELIIITLT